MTSDDRAYRRRWGSWALYDVANSSFYLTIVAAIFPVFYQALYVKSRTPAGEALSDAAVTSLRTQGASSLAFVATIAMVVVAVLGPVLGAMADRRAGKKKFLAGFAALGCLSSLLMYFIPETGVAFAAVLYCTGTVGVAGSIVFYDALLPSVARPGDVDRISTIGFAAGYLGSVILFILNSLFVTKPGWFGLRDAGHGARLSFATVGIWWAFNTIPLLLWVPEPPAPAGSRPGGTVLDAFRQLAGTFRKLRAYRQLLLFLVAFWIYGDGIGTIIKLAAAFAGSLGVPNEDLLTALVLTQLVGVPCALGFGALARRIGPKPSILIGLSVYAGICVFARFMSAPSHFYVMAVAVGTVQGGVQALSRSLFASFAPPAQAGEFFGFFSTMEKFAGIVGPLLLGLAWSEGGDPRRGILFLVAFFVVGGAILWMVDVAAGRRAAAASEPSPAAEAPVAPGAR